MAHGVTALVLCGGTSVRMGGGDKTSRPLGERSVLGTLLVGLPARWPVVCVGEKRDVGREVSWTCERPALGGPVAGIAAGLAQVDTTLVVVLAGDQPFAAGAAQQVADALSDAAADVDGVTARQSDGRAQPLLAAYRTKRLRAVIPDDPEGLSVHRTVAPLHLHSIDVGHHCTLDIDTVEDLHEAATRIETGGADPGPSR